MTASKLVCDYRKSLLSKKLFQSGKETGKIMTLFKFRQKMSSAEWFRKQGMSLFLYGFAIHVLSMQSYCKCPKILYFLFHNFFWTEFVFLCSYFLNNLVE